jgi:hypothetical protein
MIILTITAVGGLFLASKVLTGKLAPWSVSIIHALLGAAGLVLLIMSVLDGSASDRMTLGLVILVVAALGGFYLASLHLKGVVAPSKVVLIHAVVAVAGFLTLASVFLGL